MFATIFKNRKNRKAKMLSAYLRKFPFPLSPLFPRSREKIKFVEIFYLRP